MRLLNACWNICIFSRFRRTNPDARLTATTTITLPAIALAALLVGCDRDPSQHNQSSGATDISSASTRAPTNSSASAADAPPADPAYAQLLKEIVDDDGLIRYELLNDAARRDTLKGAIERMAAATAPEQPSHKLALLCNAYNANALIMAYQASRSPDFKTVNDTPGFFDSNTVKVAGKEYTLNQLKDDIRALQDPRIHCVLVWGAMSCPPLLHEPFAADRLEQQFADQCKRWIEDRSKNVTQPMRIQISEIFKQYEDDFKVQPYGDFKQFLHKFSRPGGMMREHLKYVGNGGGVQVSYWSFDWSLNQARAESSSATNEE